jgi:hypothetical protein
MAPYFHFTPVCLAGPIGIAHRLLFQKETRGQHRHTSNSIKLRDSCLTGAHHLSQFSNTNEWKSIGFEHLALASRLYISQAVSFGAERDSKSSGLTN